MRNKVTSSIALLPLDLRPEQEFSQICAACASLKRERGESTAAPAATHHLQKTSGPTGDVKDALEKRTLGARQAQRPARKNVSWDAKVMQRFRFHRNDGDG